MGDAIFPRTRSTFTLPEATIDMSRSPLKDARLASRNNKTVTEGSVVADKGATGEDESNLLSKKLGDKRSPSPSTLTDRPQLKRFKTSADNAAPSLVHARHFSDSNVLSGISRKRSATTSKPKSSDNSSARHQSPALPNKERARSVPVFPSYREFPTIDIRDISTSPTRRSPSRWEPKLKINPIQKLEPIPAQILPAVAEEPATPVQTHTFAIPNIPMSPLTPLPPTPHYKGLAGLAVIAEDRLKAVSWGQNLSEASALEPSITVKPSRLPRPANAIASTSKVKPQSQDTVPRQTTHVVTAPEAIRNASDVLMRKQDKGKGKAVKKPKVPALIAPSAAPSKLPANGPKSDKTGGGSKEKSKGKTVESSTIKEKMKPRTKVRPESVIPVFDNEDDEKPSEEPAQNETVIYPLQSLPTRKSPAFSGLDPLPPSSSSPISPPEEDERMMGMEDDVLRTDDVEMKEGGKIVDEQEYSPLLEEKPSMPVPNETPGDVQTDAVPRVPSPLFSAVTSASPSPLFSEPDHVGAETTKEDSLSQEQPVKIPSEPLSELDAKHSSTATKSRRQRKPPPLAVPRATRSTSSRIPTAKAPALNTPKKAPGHRKGNEKAKAAPPPLPETENVPESTSISHSVPSASADEAISTELPASSPILAVSVSANSELSELTDLSDSYYETEVPLKGDAGEDVEMADASVDLIGTPSKRGLGGRKSAPHTLSLPRRRSTRGQKAEDLALDAPGADFSVLPPQEEPAKVATTSTGKGKSRKSAIPVPKTPARSQSTTIQSSEKEGRPNSAPSSPVKASRTYTTDFANFTFKPVSKYVQPPKAHILEELGRLNERLRQPPPDWKPIRPSTSLGFNRDDPDSSIEFEGKSVDDALAKGGKRSSAIGLGRPSMMSNVSTAGSNVSSSSTRPLVQKKLSMFMPPGTGPGLQPKTTGMIMRGIGSGSGSNNRFPVKTGIFPGSLGSRGKKASQKTSLPSVVASPVKGGASRMNEDTEMADYSVYHDGDVTMPDTSLSGNRDDMDISELEVVSADSSSKGKGKDAEDSPKTNKRAVTLSQSMSSLPTSAVSLASTPAVGSMGPPPLPSTSSPRRAGLRSSSSSYPSGSRPQPPPKFVPEATFLEGCTVFVDVWMSDGQDTSSLYIELARDMGARIVKRVGPQCTHIVFTAGREKTVEQYFALDEAKRPKTVGAAWLRDCKTSQTRVDESKYLVDFEEHKPNMASNLLDEKGQKPKHKRRQSFIPKFLTEEDSIEDISMDGSELSIMDVEDDLPPLERARLRQSLLGSQRK